MQLAKSFMNTVIKSLFPFFFQAFPLPLPISAFPYSRSTITSYPLPVFFLHSPLPFSIFSLSSVIFFLPLFSSTFSCPLFLFFYLFHFLLYLPSPLAPCFHFLSRFQFPSPLSSPSPFTNVFHFVFSFSLPLSLCHSLFLFLLPSSYPFSAAIRFSLFFCQLIDY